MTLGERDERPDPDDLLARVAEESADAHRGRLKIFFGASPGVGKTYAMLAEAQRLREEGRDVVVGVVETHNRPETARLLAGLEVLARQRVDYRGHSIEEFALDAAVARKPQTLLVDELAHTNVPGSRHPKRYQDVLELLAAGIDVYTTVNVQHLESLNDVVGGITGIKVRETLPDRIFDQADEIVLVDLPADDLIQRLRQGKVYVTDQAERAIQSFFRKGNLLALRELAMRRAADRVDGQMRTLRRGETTRTTWKTRDAILVAVGPSEGESTVVRSAARLAAALEAPWHAVYVETPELQRLSDSRRRKILQTLKLAEELGAETATVGAPDVVRALVDYAYSHNLGSLIVGRGGRRKRILDRLRRSIVDRVNAIAPDLDVLLVTRDRSTPPTDAELVSEREVFRRRGYAGALALCVAATLIATPLLEFFDLANIVMVFMLSVVTVALLFGRGPAIFAAIANVVAFDFFFVPPRFSFAVSDAQYLVTFGVMLVVGLLIGQLTARLRYQARVASSGEDRSRRLFDMARELGSALTQEQVAEIGERFVADSRRNKVAVLTLDENDALVVADSRASKPEVDPAIARWSLDRAEPAGFGTDTLPGAPSLYLPLKAPMRTRGVLVVETTHPRLLLIPEQRRLLETFAALIAIALERVHFVTVAQKTLVSMESERLRNSVLAALSHDLRTPLTVLVGLSDALATKLGDSPIASDARALRDHARRTAQLVDKLLEMARLEAERVELHQDWQSLEELVGGALHSLESVLSGRSIDVDLPRDLLIHCDGVLIERVLVNLLENAAKFTPPGSPIRVTASRRGDAIDIAVEDRGPGLPPGRETAIFEKFTRGDREPAVPGVGLGLAISSAIVHAHGGTIRAANREGGGARFVFSIPAGSPPKVDAEAEPQLASA